MSDGNRKRLIGVFVAAFLTGIAGLGCHAGKNRPIPFTPPLAEALAPTDDPCDASAVPPSMTMANSPNCGPYDLAASDSCPMRKPRNVIAFSGGGAYGAYSAGFMEGWTKSGTRPEFDVVTGISTGSLIAPLAFLGPDYDARLANLYTRIQPTDIFRVRTWVLIPFKDSIATSVPLRNLIESQISPDLMEKIAAEHRKGRRLYVGTTNLDTRRMVVWDMGAIACRPCPEGCRLFRDVLLASCSVPGMLPPVKFNLEVDGKCVTELHVDGGATAQMFVPSHVFALASAGITGDASRTETGNLYAIVAGKLYPDAAPVRSKVLPVLGATTSALMYAYCRADLSNLYGMSRAAGLRYHLIALRPGFPTLETSVSFDPKDMQRLFQEGVTQGSAGPAWKSGPPTLSPGDGDYIRNGVRLRTVPTLNRE